MKKQNLKYLVACAALVSSGSALAGVTGNVGVASEYMFRGIPQTNGAAVQGGLDYAHDSGVYLGAWASNVNFAGAEGGNEFDLYGGYTFKAGAVALDFGAIGYFYSETGENGGDAAGNIDFAEVYGGFSAGPVSAKVYFSPDYNNNSKESIYATGTVSIPVSDSVSIFVQAAHTAWKDTDSYFDYSAGVSKTIEGGLAFSLGVFDTYGRGATTGAAYGPVLPDVDDEPKFVVSAKKTFEL